MALDSGDTAWILTSTALVLFMTLPGLALFYGGLVQSKNATSVFMQCLTVTCIATMVWVTFGYTLSFSGTHKFLGDMDKAFLVPVKEAAAAEHGTIPESLFFLFQATFAIITPGLFLGALVERARYPPLMLFCALWVIVVYAPVCHWVWGGGWLADMHIRDFAGGLVVHATAGTTALVLAKLLPPRQSFPHDVQAPHSGAAVFAGASMLWVGWFGFNAGSALAADSSAAMAAVVTHISASGGTLTWLAIEGYRTKPTLVAGVTGMVAGLGSITPASGFVGIPGALLMGPIAGVVTYCCAEAIKEKLSIDDSLDVAGVHGVGGIVGTLLTAPFSATGMGGVGYHEDAPGGELFGVQLLGCVVTVAWSAVLSLILFKVIGLFMVWAHTVSEQEVGLDEVVHGERCYTVDVDDVKDFRAEAAAAAHAYAEGGDALPRRRSAPRPTSAQRTGSMRDRLSPARDLADDSMQTVPIDLGASCARSNSGHMDKAIPLDGNIVVVEQENKLEVVDAAFEERDPAANPLEAVPKKP
eukprot:TRINITY_DN22579_c0_g1_i1.p1 TRINITY_DN22579_c0_g1~~TRINITY_DN22579_c0_g1_i1.p1  ORF type:complete len:527 (+),score=159.39 TRINITY_DN22579_c0_g1_i1:89-1669(+)